MKNEFVFLTSASEVECELICQRLIKADIKYETREYTEGFIFDLYGASSPIGKKIFVLNSDLNKAKELLGIEKQDLSQTKAKRIPLIFRVMALIILAIILLWIGLLFEAIDFPLV